MTNKPLVEFRLRFKRLLIFASGWLIIFLAGLFIHDGIGMLYFINTLFSITFGIMLSELAQFKVRWVE